MTSAEVDMNRHDIGEVEFNEDDPFFATENRRFVKGSRPAQAVSYPQKRQITTRRRNEIKSQKKT